MKLTRRYFKWQFDRFREIRVGLFCSTLPYTRWRDSMQSHVTILNVSRSWQRAAQSAGKGVE